MTLLMRRSADFIISLLAVLKAGCAYSALPGELPEQALHLVLQNAAPALVITNAGLHASLPKGRDAPRVFNFDSAPDAEALSKRWGAALAVAQANCYCCGLAIVLPFACISGDQIVYGEGYEYTCASPEQCFQHCAIAVKLSTLQHAPTCHTQREI